MHKCLIRERIRLEQRIEERESPKPKSPSNLSKSEMATASLIPISPVFSISTSPKSPITTSTATPPTVWHQTRSHSSLRRQILHGLALSPLILIKETAISEAKEVEVLAGNVQPYQFILPPTWKQTRVANILSGNYCQPKCAEPWVEVKFEDEKQGKVQVVASPLIRLTNKPNASIEEIGSPEKLIASLGPFVTGNSYDPDELLETSIEKLGDQTYYKYVLETPYALTGTHNLAKATAKGSTVVLFVASANDKQWQTSEKTLKAILDSFQV